MQISKAGRMMRSCAAALLCAALCGCSVRFGTNKKVKEPAPDTIVAHPTNGAEQSELNVTYATFAKEYKYYLANSGVEDDTAEDIADACKSLRGNTINYIINEKIILCKAKELGVYELTEEEQKAVDEDFEATLEKQIALFGDQAQAEYSQENDGAELSDEEKREKGSQKLDELLEKCGMTRDDLYWWTFSSMVTQKLREKIGDEVPYSEAEEQLREIQADAEKTYKESAAEYAQSGLSQLWMPEGTRHIKHILLEFDDDTQSELRALRGEGKDSEADALREEKAKALEAKAEEVKQKLADGAKFDDLITEYSDDTAGMQRYPEGFTVYPAGGTFVKEFQAAAFVPAKIGDTTSCLTDYGIHIMEYSGDAKVAEEDLKNITEYIHDQMRQGKFSDRMAEWAEEYAYEINYEALRLDAPEQDSE